MEILFCLEKKELEKKKFYKNLVLFFCDFFNLFFILYVVLRNGNFNCWDGCINLLNYFLGGDEILNVWEMEMVSFGIIVEY